MAFTMVLTIKKRGGPVQIFQNESIQLVIPLHPSDSVDLHWISVRSRQYAIIGLSQYASCPKNGPRFFADRLGSIEKCWPIPSLVGGLEHCFFHILGIIIPTDELIFRRGRSTTNQPSTVAQMPKISGRESKDFSRNVDDGQDYQIGDADASWWDGLVFTGESSPETIDVPMKYGV